MGGLGCQVVVNQSFFFQRGKSLCKIARSLCETCAHMFYGVSGFSRNPEWVHTPQGLCTLRGRQQVDSRSDFPICKAGFALVLLHSRVWFGIT